jgi:hypothetical protein
MAAQRRRPNGREVRQKGKGMKRLATWHRKGDVQSRLWREATERLDGKEGAA